MKEENKNYFFLIVVSALLLASCSPSSGRPSALTSIPQQTPSPQQAAGTFSGRIKTTTIRSEGLDIAVMVASPKTPRYPEGAGVVVVASPIFSEGNGFMTDPDLTSLGLIQVSYLWPGNSDPKTKAKSSGSFDYGGDQSIQVLRDVIRFAANRLADKAGRYIVSMSSVAPLVGEVGVYAFSDAGIPAIRAFSLYGAQLQGLAYFVGREVPTVDSISAMELGYYNAAGQPVLNPLYSYPASFGTAALTLSYANVRWDSSYTSSTSKAVGIPYLDLDSNGSLTPGDFVFAGQPPIMFGKRYYSAALEADLLANGSLSVENWPSDLATPQEATQAWQIRQTPGLFATLQNDDIVKNLKVMLVFAQVEHAQVAPDKPHIHQLYQGFRFEAHLWVRLNPARAYVDAMYQNAGLTPQGSFGLTPTPITILTFPDNPANTQPEDWAKIGDYKTGNYTYPPEAQADRLVPLAAVAQMADQEHDGYWSENLAGTLYTYPALTPQP